MENIKTCTVEEKRLAHEIYCDRCGTFLGTSVEAEDGYYENKGEAQWSFYVKDRWLTKRGNYCDGCKKKVDSAVYNGLCALGFHDATSIPWD